MSKRKHGLRVRVHGGQVQAVYDDRLLDVLQHGTVYAIEPLKRESDGTACYPDNESVTD